MEQHLIQGTDEWKELRKTKITATDLCAIMGVSKWVTPMELWEKKLGFREEDKDNQYMARGRELEPIARELFGATIDTCLEPKVVFHGEHPWMMASLDGISHDGMTVCEVKCPGKIDHETAERGRVPDHYYPQLQWQAHVAGVKIVWYVSFDGSKLAIVSCPRDDQYIAKMVVKAKEFYRCLISYTPPEEEYVSRTDDQWKKWAARLEERKKATKAAKEEEEELRQEIIASCKDRSTKGFGMRIQRQAVKGSVDWNSIPEIKTVDVEKYRKSGYVKWVVTYE